MNATMGRLLPAEGGQIFATRRARHAALLTAAFAMLTATLGAWAQVSPSPDEPPPSDVPAAEARRDKQPAAPRSVAVIELFNAEGCPDGPQADKLLESIATDERRANEAVYTLAFHVDTWDTRGWKDSLADPHHAQRQRLYARRFGLERPYVPQMIVNGQTEFPGTDRFRAQNSIRTALAQPAPLSLTLTATRASQNKPIIVSYQVSQPSRGTLINVAILENKLVSEITRGENAGQTLTHNHVVRDFKSLSAGKGGRGRIRLMPPKTWNATNGVIIGFVQDKKTMAVLGAASCATGHLPSAAATRQTSRSADDRSDATASPRLDCEPLVAKPYSGDH